MSGSLSAISPCPCSVFCPSVRLSVTKTSNDTAMLIIFRHCESLMSHKARYSYTYLPLKLCQLDIGRRLY